MESVHASAPWKRIQDLELLVAILRQSSAPSSVLPGVIDVKSPPFLAKGDGVTDDTAAIQAAVNAAAALPPGEVWFPQPSPYYLISAEINVPANVSLRGLGGAGSAKYPMITQATYGINCFVCTGDHITITDLSGQYGPTTFLSGALSAGAGSIVVDAQGPIAAGDFLVLDQYPNLEVVQVSLAYAGGTTVALVAPTTLPHADDTWVRDQQLLPTNWIDNNSRSLGGFAFFHFGNGCGVYRCGVQSMVGGVFFRGNPTTNVTNNTDNTIDTFETDFVQFGVLLQMQTRTRVTNVRYTNATGGQPAAPGHGIYATSNNGPAAGWSNIENYNIYRQVSFGGNQYVSLVSGNINNQPDISPAFWQNLGSNSATPPAWQQNTYDLVMANHYIGPKFDLASNWAPYTLKFVVGATVTGIVCEYGNRSVNLQECSNVNWSNFVFLNFEPPVGGNNASIDNLNCSNCHFSDGLVLLTSPTGGSIDMPVVFERVANNVASGFGGHNNTYDNIKSYTNYSGAYTASAFLVQGSDTCSFVDCLNSDAGSNNNYSYQFKQETSTGRFPNNCAVVLPQIAGTTRGVFVDAGTTGVVLSIDNNLIPSVATWTDPGGGAVVTNRYETHTRGSLVLNYQDSAGPILQLRTQNALSGSYIECKDNLGRFQFILNNSSGLQTRLFSSTAGSGSFLGIGYNATAGFGAINNVFAGVVFPINGNAPGTGNAGLFAVASENQNAGAFGTDLNFQVVPSGGTSAFNSFRLYNNGDVVMNPRGSSLATGATAGFTYIPNCSGIPTGTPTARSGATPIIYDLTNNITWVNRAGIWFAIYAQKIVGLSPANNTIFTPNEIVRLGAGDSGNSYALPTPTTCGGTKVTLKCIASVGGPFTFTITSNVSGNVEGVASFTWNPTAIGGGSTFISFESDGTNWWVVSKG